MRAAGVGAGGVRISCWLLAVGSWLAVSGYSVTQTTPKSSGPVHQSQACAPVSDGGLKCPRFGFTYKVPFGWVDRTTDMQKEEVDEGAPTDSSAKPDAKNAPGSETLLAVFARPPGAPGDTIDSAVVIASEPLKNYPQVKTASDYFGPIAELAEQRGFKAESEPYSFSVGAKQLVREDFRKQRGKLSMRQSSLAMIEKGYIVSFTFLAGSEDDADGLIGNLSFAAKFPPKK